MLFADEPVEPQIHDIATRYRVTLVPFYVEQLEPSWLRKYHPSNFRCARAPPAARWRRQQQHARPLRTATARSSASASSSPSPPAPPQLAGHQRVPRAERRGRAGKVLMADVRDAMFQSDPFAIVTSPGFYAFHGIERVGECGWNGWIRDCFGAQMLQKVTARRSSARASRSARTPR